MTGISYRIERTGLAQRAFDHQVAEAAVPAPETAADLRRQLNETDAPEVKRSLRERLRSFVIDAFSDCECPECVITGKAAGRFAAYAKRRDYPFEGQVVQEVVPNNDGTLTVMFDDCTFIIIRKGADGTA